jgi:threonine/homoserine/homoserine lactone efflux protein
MLTQTIGELLPFAVVVALSPIPIVAVIVMLGTPRARTNGPAFTIGWIAGLTAVSVVVLVVAHGASDPDSGPSDTVNGVKLGIGVLFLVMAVRRWRQRPRKGEEPEMPGWMKTVDTFTPRRALVLGLALSGANPKNLALTLAAAGTIAQAGMSGSDDAVAVAVFVVIGSLSVAGPVLFSLLAPDAAARPLAATKEFMVDHSPVIMIVLLLVIGAKLLGDGITGLSS